MTLKFNGNTSLKGNVSPSGSVYSALTIISCSLLFERVILENVPRVRQVEELLAKLESLGAKSEWASGGALEIEVGLINDAAVSDSLVIAPMLARNGLIKSILKTALPKESARFLESLGVNFSLAGKGAVTASLGTAPLQTISVDHSLEFSLTALIIGSRLAGPIRLTDFLMVEETQDLIDFFKSGGLIITTDPKIPGEVVIENCPFSFSSTKYQIPASAIESLFWASAAVMSFGDLIIKAAPKERLVSFLSKLTTLGAHYEFDHENLRVWQDEGHLLSPLDFEITKKMPLYDFLPVLVPIMLKAQGTSHIRGIRLEEETYIKDLNLFNAKIINGELTGPAFLKGSKVALTDFSGGLAVILAALGANGRSEILEAEKVTDYFAGLPEKLDKLSGKL